jgi:hypothetical protein
VNGKCKTIEEIDALSSLLRIGREDELDSRVWKDGALRVCRVVLIASRLKRKRAMIENNPAVLHAPPGYLTYDNSRSDSEVAT